MRIPYPPRKGGGGGRSQAGVICKGFAPILILWLCSEARTSSALVRAARGTLTKLLSGCTDGGSVLPSGFTRKISNWEAGGPRGEPSSAGTLGPECATKPFGTHGKPPAATRCVHVPGAPAAPLLLFGASLSHTVYQTPSSAQKTWHPACRGERMQGSEVCFTSASPEPSFSGAWQLAWALLFYTA